MSNNALEFQSIQIKVPNSNTFDLSHEVKMTGAIGKLMPCMVLECMPGDFHKLSCQNLIRFAPLVSPVMHRMDARVEYFFVPHRILWPNWEKFITNDPSQPTFPYVEISDTMNPDPTINDAWKKFLDYMGIPPFSAVPGASETTRVSPIPMAAYQLIWNEYYRDQNLQSDIKNNILLEDGTNNGSRADLFNLRNRAWEHDQFTSSLPFAQKGNPVDIPLGSVGLSADWQSSDNPVFLRNTTGNQSTFENPLTNLVGIPGIGVETASPGIYENGQVYDPKDTLQVNPTTINDLRTALKLQEWLEKNARGGTRYIEQILVHFGVKSSNKALQRPEYITGVKTPIIISEVLNSTGEDGGLPQGNMAGHGISVQEGNVGQYYCEEHGYIIGIMSIMPRTNYSQGIPKHYLRNDPFQFPWPEFANLGEEEVQLQEIYAYTPNRLTPWGYLPRYYEMKQMPSRIAGDFRSSLAYWHLGRIFENEPALNDEFIECDYEAEDLNRIFAVTDTTDKLYINIVHQIKTRRILPVFGTPML